jgi:hypothetical protein
MIANELNIWKILNNNPNVAPFLGVITSHEHDGFNQRYIAPWPVCEYYKNRGLDDVSLPIECFEVGVRLTCSSGDSFCATKIPIARGGFSWLVGPPAVTPN